MSDVLIFAFGVGVTLVVGAALATLVVQSNRGLEENPDGPDRIRDPDAHRVEAGQ